MDSWLANANEERLADAWTKRLWKRGQAVSVRSERDMITGVIRGVRQDGALMLESEDGRLIPIISGELSLVE